MNVTVTAHVSVAPLIKLGEAFHSIQRVPAHPAVEDMFTQWATRYSAAMRRRFNEQSRGGGEWAPLTPATIRRRRKGKRGSRFTKERGAQSQRSFLARNRRGMLVASPAAYQILRDTGSLFGALTIGARGNLTQRGPGTITFGIEGGSTGTGPSLGQIAKWHNDGAGRNPVRRILVPPNDQTLRGMGNDAKTAASKIVAEIQRSV